MNPRGNPHTLAQARRRVSLDKRQRVLTALTALEQQGKKITHAAVARTAGVSTWLTYAEGIRELRPLSNVSTPPPLRPLTPEAPPPRCAQNLSSPGRRSGL
jgi:hypothetical protein